VTTESPTLVSKLTKGTLKDENRLIWCNENRINIKTYYHWQKLVCQATCQELPVIKEPKPQAVNVASSPIFAEVSIPESRANQLAIAIKYNAMQINIYCGADAATVETAIAAIRDLC
jgi:hypothetical protein